MRSIILFEFTYRANELIDAGKAFFSLDTAFHFPLVTLFVPHLEALIELANKVSADLVINDTQKTTTSILRRVTDVDS